MSSLEEIINVIFGGQVDASKIIVILVSIYAFVNSITERLAKKKVWSKEVEETQTQKDLKALKQKQKAVCECISSLADIVLTAYLSSNTIPVETKQKIAAEGEKLKCVGEIDLTESTNKLIAAATSTIPQETLNEKKEKINEAVKEVGETTKTANDAVQAAINNIKVS